jgi:hypothetical protein
MKLKSIYGDNLVEYIFAMHGVHVIWNGEGECPF